MPFTRAQLQPFVVEKWITAQRHPTLPLTIYNYSKSCQYDRHWTPETIACRGLVLDDDDRVVMRPFPKFFNKGEHDDETMPTGPYRVYEKYDGSLFLVARYGLEMVTATRGSFTSPQADLGRSIMNRMGLTILPIPGLTLCYELIHPENRIVVDYGNRTELVLLAAIDNATGKAIDDCDFDEFPHANAFTLAEMEAILTDPAQQANREGFVLHFHESNQRVKVKFDEYVRLHKIVTGINARHIWERLSKGQLLDDVLERVPDEFYDWVKQTQRDLDAAFQREVSRHVDDYEQVCTNVNGNDRAAFARSVAAHPGVNKSAMFLLYDDRPIDDLIWKDLRPEATRPFREDEAA